MLHEGVSGQDDVPVAVGHVLQGTYESVDRLDGVEDGIPQVHLEVGGHLVVPAPPGVQFPSGRTYHLGQLDLHVGVDVLQGVVHVEPAFLQLMCQLLESADYAVGVLRGDDLACLQHTDVGEGTHDVVERHLGVHVQGGGELQGAVVHTVLEPSGPEGFSCHRDHCFFSGVWALAAVWSGRPHT